MVTMERPAASPPSAARSGRRPGGSAWIAGRLLAAACLAGTPDSSPAARSANLPAPDDRPRLPAPYEWVLETIHFEAGADWFVLSLPTGAPWARQTLRDPPRVVLDLGGTLSRLPGAPGLREIPIERGPVRCLRTSQYSQEPLDYRVRVVLELRREYPCEIEDRGDEIVVAVAAKTKQVLPPRVGEAGDAAARVESEIVARVWDEVAPALLAPARPAVSRVAGREPVRSRRSTVAGARPATERPREMAAETAATKPPGVGPGEPALAPPAWREAMRSADLLFRAGRADSAYALYAGVAALDPPDEEAAWAAYQAGNCWLLRRDLQAALESYRRVVERWPGSVWAGLARDHLAARGEAEGLSTRTWP